jgi:hypothetical protein
MGHSESEMKLKEINGGWRIVFTWGSKKVNPEPGGIEKE